MDRFRGKSALVTGGASGIGRALCEALVARGSSVFVGDIDESALAETVAQLRAQGGQAHSLCFDVGDGAAFEAAIAEVLGQHGALDLIVNNAGITLGGEFEAMSLEDWERMVNVHLWGVIHGTRLAYAQMLQQGHGCIVNVSSGAGLHPAPYQTAYSALKHAVVGLSTSLREEARPHGIRVNVVCPGLVDTPAVRSPRALEGYDFEEVLASTPMPWTAPADAAAAILRGIERDQRTIVFPWLMKAAYFAHRLFPALVARQVGIQLAPKKKTPAR